MVTKANFFLDAIEEDGPGFRGAAQAGCEVIPLIDRVNAFKAMERAVLAATRSVHFSGWVFIPDAPLQDASVKSAVGGSTWLDLFTFIADRSVQVRIILTDFDPLLDPDLHRLSWRAIADLAHARSTLSASNASNLQFFPSRHEAFIDGRMLALLGLDARLKAELKASLKDYNSSPFADALSLYQRTPGHWSSIKPDMSKHRFVASAHPRDGIHLGAHHQKLCIVDAEIAFCGGMDVTDLALNDRSHKLKRRPGRRSRLDSLWHDIHCEVRGPVVFEMERNFVERWQREAQLFAINVPEFAAQIPDGATLPGFFFDIPLKQSRRRPRLVGPSMAQAQRTVSIAGKTGLGAILNPIASLFQTVRSDILEGYQLAIEQATQYVYFENQYFRARQIADALIARRKQVPHLKVIVVLPVAPEEFDESQKDNPLVMHPIAVQKELIDTLTAEFGADIGFFSLVAPVASKRRSRVDQAGSPQIYVHSKVCIVDDVFASIGSANTNGRGFLLDTELNVAWVDQAMKVGEFRIDLWSELLGLPTREIAAWDAKIFVTKWREIAARNAASSPRRRSGFVVAHDNEKFADLIGGFSLPQALEALLSIVDLSHQPAPAEPLSTGAASERIPAEPDVS